MSLPSGFEIDNQPDKHSAPADFILDELKADQSSYAAPKDFILDEVIESSPSFKQGQPPPTVLERGKEAVTDFFRKDPGLGPLTEEDYAAFKPTDVSIPGESAAEPITSDIPVSDIEKQLPAVEPIDPTLAMAGLTPEEAATGRPISTITGEPVPTPEEEAAGGRAAMAIIPYGFASAVRGMVPPALERAVMDPLTKTVVGKEYVSPIDEALKIGKYLPEEARVAIGAPAHMAGAIVPLSVSFKTAGAIMKAAGLPTDLVLTTGLVMDQIAGHVARGGIAGAIYGGLEGGTPQDMAEDAAFFGVLEGSLGAAGKIFKKLFSSNWYRNLEVKERGLVVQSADDLLRAGHSEGTILRTLNDPAERTRLFKAALQKRKASVDLTQNRQRFEENPLDAANNAEYLDKYIQGARQPKPSVPVVPGKPMPIVKPVEMMRGEVATIPKPVPELPAPDWEVIKEGKGAGVMVKAEKIKEPAVKGEGREFAKEIDTKAQEAATSPLSIAPEPTEAQIEMGNYKKGHIKIQGLDISIENPKGSERKGIDPSGKKWSVTMKHHYGYIKGTVGKDKEHLDVFVGDNPESKVVFVVDQVNPETRAFDEHKIIVGTESIEEAQKTYLDNYEKGWNGLGDISEMKMDHFKEWIESGNTKKPFNLPAKEEKLKAVSEKVKAETPTMLKESDKVNDVTLGTLVDMAAENPAKALEHAADATVPTPKLIEGIKNKGLKAMGEAKTKEGRAEIKRNLEETLRGIERTKPEDAEAKPGYTPTKEEIKNEQPGKNRSPKINRIRIIKTRGTKSYADINDLGVVKTITVYRAVPAGTQGKIEPGDFIAADEEVAKFYARDLLQRNIANETAILTKKVKTSEIRLHPDHQAQGVENEFIYNPEVVEGKKPKKPIAEVPAKEPVLRESEAPKAEKGAKWISPEERLEKRLVKSPSVEVAAMKKPFKLATKGEASITAKKLDLIYDGVQEFEGKPSYHVFLDKNQKAVISRTVELDDVKEMLNARKAVREEAERIPQVLPPEIRTAIGEKAPNYLEELGGLAKVSELLRSHNIVGGEAIKYAYKLQEGKITPEELRIALLKSAKPEKEPISETRARLLENIKSEKGSSELINDLSRLGADAIKRGHTSFKAFSAEMKTVLGDAWAKVKDLMRRAYKTAKKILKSERGAVDIGKPKPEAEYKKPRLTQKQKEQRAKKKAIKEKQLKIENAKEAKKQVHAMIRDRRQNLNLSAYDTNLFVNDIEQQTSKVQREIIPFIIEKTDIPKSLNRPDLEKAYKKDKDDLTVIARQVKEHFDASWLKMKKNIPDMSVEQIENYVTHIWDLNKDQKRIVTNWFTTQNRFLKKRYIETLKEGIDELGLTPKVLDIGEIIRIHDGVASRAIENVKFVEGLKGLKHEGMSLIARADLAPQNWAYFDHPALRRGLVIPGKLKMGEKVSPELSGLLEEMGVAIGRRISPVAFGKPVGKAGEYRPSEPPEVRFQRFMSNRTIAHEIGHHLDETLGLGYKFLNNYASELYAINRERIESRIGEKGKYGEAYARSTEEQIAEFFATLFTDASKAYRIAPNATADALNRLRQDEVLSKLIDFDFEKQAKNLIEEQVSTLVKLSIKVHPDLEKPLKVIFESRIDHPVIQAYEVTNGILKKTNLSLSLFHHGALGETGIAIMGLAKTLNIYFNPVKIYKAMAKGKFDIFEKEPIARDAIGHGLQVGATADIPVNMIQSKLNNLARMTKNVSLINKTTEFVRTFNEVWDKALWNYLHDNLKLYAYESLVSKVDPAKNVTKQKQEITQFINDTFGGQNWDTLMVSPKSLQIMTWSLLSADWTTSTVRQALSPTGIGKVHKETANLRRKLGAHFWIKAGLYFGVGINMLNYTFRKWDEEEHPEYYEGMGERTFLDKTMAGNTMGHKTHLFVGRHEDGTERYIRWGKQFRELPELLFDDTGFSPISATFKKVGGKLAPMIQLTSKITTGTSPSGFRDDDIYGKKGWDRVYGMGKVLIKSPLPFATRALFQKDKKFHLTDLAMPSSKGMTRWKSINLFKHAITKRDDRLLKETYQFTLMNNLPAYTLFSTALTILKAESTREFNEGVKTIEDVKKMLDKVDNPKDLIRLGNKLKRTEKENIDRKLGMDLLDQAIEDIKEYEVIEGK